MEQCQRSRVPEIVGPLAWSEVLDGLGAIEQAWFLDTASPAPPPASGGKGKLVLLVGPEGGWTGRECEQLARAGARPVSLGPRVLRVETAAVVGAALALRR